MSHAASAFVTTSDGADLGSRRVHIVQGEYDVTRDPSVILTTLLGSCVAACISDPVAGVGGMNHFLLPESEGAGASAHMRYGVHSMELLINGLLKLGARRDRMQVWLFGGAKLFDRLTDIGSKNAEFAEAFVKREELTPMGGSLRGLTFRCPWMRARMSNSSDLPTRAMMASFQPNAVSLARVLGSLEEEVSSLARMSDDVQDALSNALADTPMTSADVVSVQNLDVIAQHLGAIATYVKQLSTQVSDEWAVRPELAAAMINLSGLAQRLSLQPAVETVDESDDPFLF